MCSLRRAAEFIAVILVLAASAAAAPPVKAPWLRYEVRDSMAYARIELTAIDETNVTVRIDGYSPEKERIDYAAKLSPAEARWLQMTVESIDFGNPDRLDFAPAGGHGGIKTVVVRIGDEIHEARFGRDDEFDGLTDFVFRLVRQAETIRCLERHERHDIYYAVTEKTVLQPQAFVEPLVKHIHSHDDQLAEDLLALSVLATPEEWGGVVGEVLEATGERPAELRDSVSRREYFLDVMTSHPFYADLPDSHSHALIQILRIQSAIESKKGGRSAAEYAERVSQIEQELLSSE